MNEPSANQPQDETDPVNVYRVIGLVVIAVISGSLVFTFRQLAWHWFPVLFAVGVIACVFIGAIYGVPVNSSLAMMVVVAGLVEGAYQGWKAYGLLGFLLGGPVGFLSGGLLFMFYLMVMSAVVILCGGNPFVNAFPEEESSRRQ